METKQRVAIVGSGLAGLTTAHLLHNDRQQRYAVKVFECVSKRFATVALKDTDGIGKLPLP